MEVENAVFSFQIRKQKPGKFRVLSGFTISAPKSCVLCSRELTCLFISAECMISQIVLQVNAVLTTCIHQYASALS